MDFSKKDLKHYNFWKMAINRFYVATVVQKMITTRKISKKEFKKTSFEQDNVVSGMLMYNM